MTKLLRTKTTKFLKSDTFRIISTGLRGSFSHGKISLMGVSKKRMETHKTTVPDTSTNELNLRKMTEDGDFASIPESLIPIEIVNIYTSCPCLPASRHRKGLD